MNNFENCSEITDFKRAFISQIVTQLNKLNF